MLHADKDKIKEILNELIENSIKHNHLQKHLRITIESRVKQNPWILGTNYHGNYLKLIISDNGAGIPKEKKNWVFLPLNTTVEKGSGLGLFIIKKTLEKMNGFIMETGKNGANFEIYIPTGEQT